MALCQNVRSSLTRFIGLALVLAAGIAEADSVLPAKSQANVLARVLAYDRNLKARAGDAVVVGVVYAASSAPSAAEADEMFTAFKQLEKFVLLGLPLRVEKIAFTDVAALRAAISERGIDALFVCTGLDTDVAKITTVARDVKQITLTGQRRYVSQGVAVGSVVVDNKPALIFNKTASEAEGSSFSSQFVTLTTPVE